MHRDVIAFAHAALEAGEAVALAVLTDSGRDTPGVPGAMLAVLADGRQQGTVGGGSLEAGIKEDCLAALADPDAAVSAFSHSLTADGGLGMVCGGDVKGIITVMRSRKRLVVFGGGHVGRKVCEAGLAAGFAVTVIEDREEYAVRLPGVQTIAAADFGAAARELRAGADCHVVIATRGHAQDAAVLHELAGRDCGYLGMVGSRAKVAGMRRMLLERGVSEEAVSRIHTPVGLDIDDGTPGEIAIGIVAEILAVKNRRDVLRHRRERGAMTASANCC